MKSLFTLVFMLSFGISQHALTQQTTTANKLSGDFLTFFTGNWTGEDEFASGKKIAATVSFKITLDSSWLSYEHEDKSPNRYKALSMWGMDITTGQFLAYSFDNFHGHRKFESDGWKDGKLVLTTSTSTAERGLSFQRFIYEKLDEKRFKMTFETSKDGITWKLGDYLVFTKM